MAKWTRSAFMSAASAYQWALLRRMLIPLSVFVVAVVAIVVTDFTVGGSLKSPLKPVVAFALVILAAQLTMMAFKRRVSETSGAQGFTCPSCGFGLGLRYATVRRTGTCVKCGAQLIRES